MSSALSGDVKGSLPNGKWCHRNPTPEEMAMRTQLGPWLRREMRRDKNGEWQRVTLKDCYRGNA